MSGMTESQIRETLKEEKQRCVRLGDEEREWMEKESAVQREMEAVQAEIEAVRVRKTRREALVRVLQKMLANQ